MPLNDSYYSWFTGRKVSVRLCYLLCRNGKKLDKLTRQLVNQSTCQPVYPSCHAAHHLVKVPRKKARGQNKTDAERQIEAHHT